MRRFTLLLSVAAVLPAPAFAQASAPASQEEQEAGRIVVTAGGLERLDLLAGTSVVQGEELHRHADGQLGEVLAHLPGVAATSFAPGASRPVLRGFQGDRVRVLIDGIGAIDASSTSADHAVALDPLMAERIEVLRGPAVMLYGGSAIGGAVNVIDRRIPRSLPQGGFSLDALGAIDSANDLREAGASADIAIGRNIVWHVDGSARKTDDVEIPGYVAADVLRQELIAEAAEDPDEAEELLAAANRRGFLPDSETRTYSIGTGLSWLGSGASLGASAGYYDSRYGVPLRPGAHHHHHHDHDHDHDDHGHGDESVSIGLKQFRADLRGELELGGGFFRELISRWGYSNYTHTEFEGGEIGTVFDVEGVEGRVELIQADRGGWRGHVGGQYLFRDFAAEGAEAFVPPNTTRQFALFTLQEVQRGPFELELGGRYERTELKVESEGLERGFDTFSGAIGLSHSAGGIRFGLNGSMAERALSAEELFAHGPHIATQQFEIGDPTLDKERAWGLEAYGRASLGGTQLALGIYQTWFDGYVYLEDTGLEEDHLPVFAYAQSNADFFGVEAEASAPLWRGNGVTLVGEAHGDYVRATLAEGTPVPRIPPVSLLGALELQGSALDFRTEVQWTGAQTRVATLETPTDDFAHLNFAVTWRPFADRELSLLLQVDNALNEEGRRHTSFTKDFVPLAGRNVKLSLRTSL